jgi:two-component system sensor histidine kinase PhoQ
MTSLTTRVTLSAMIVLAIFITLTGLALERAFQQSALPAISERLSAQLFLTMAETEIDKQGQLRMPDNLPTPKLNLPGSGLYAWILDKENEILWQSPSTLGLNVTPPIISSVFEQQPLGKALHFITTLKVEWEYEDKTLPLRFIVAEDQQSYLDELDQFRHTLWFWLGIMAVLLLIALALLLIWGLRPLRQAAAEVSAIESGQQHSLTRRYPPELQQLTGNINTLLAHEQAQQKRYRDALADLAHSLKTPLAILRSQDKQADPSFIDDQISRMDDIIQYQLQRAANAGRSALMSPVAVKPLLERLINSLHKVHYEKQVNLIQAIQPDAVFRGDPEDLMELLGNLLDNAFKWCQETIRIEASNQNQRLQIMIEDDGPGISEEQKDLILQRGMRADESTPGHGIGLAMVADIIAAYDGELKIESSDQQGARIRISLPGNKD